MALEAFAEAASRLPLQTPLDPLREAPAARWIVDDCDLAVPLPAGTASGTARAAAAQVIGALAFFPPWMIALRRGDVAVVGARCLGLWGVFANRVVEETSAGDDAAGAFEVSLTYATLAGHFETGVERFRARRDGAQSPVCFSIHAVSRAAGAWKRTVHALAARSLQRRFGPDALAGFRSALLGKLSGSRSA